MGTKLSEMFILNHQSKKKGSVSMDQNLQEIEKNMEELQELIYLLYDNKEDEGDANANEEELIEHLGKLKSLLL